jgi:cell wall-associated NlpC family hydrolase
LLSFGYNGFNAMKRTGGSYFRFLGLTALGGLLSLLALVPFSLAFPSHADAAGFSLTLAPSTNLWTSSSLSDSERKVVMTSQNHSLPFFFGGLAKKSGYLGSLYGQGYLYNQHAISGIASLTITYSGTGKLHLGYGYALGNYIASTDAIVSGTPITLSFHPNFFYLENVSGTKPYATSYSKTVDGTAVTCYSYQPSYDSASSLDIASIAITYSCVNEATSSQKLHRYIDILASSLNLRKGPGTSYDVVATLTKNTYDHCLAYREADAVSGWYRTYYRNQDCWVSGNAAYTSLVAAPSLGSEDEEAIIVEAEKRIGDCYYLGATRYVEVSTGNKYSTFDECYYDCSSFTQRAYYDGAGLLIGNYTGAQITNGSKVASSASLTRADLCLYTSGTTPVSEANVGHVTLWCGAGRLLQASGANYTGEVKMFANWDGYWKNYFIEGRHLV